MSDLGGPVMDLGDGSMNLEGWTIDLSHSPDLLGVPTVDLRGGHRSPTGVSALHGLRRILPRPSGGGGRRPEGAARTRTSRTGGTGAGVEAGP